MLFPHVKRNKIHRGIPEECFLKSSAKVSTDRRTSFSGRKTYCPLERIKTSWNLFDTSIISLWRTERYPLLRATATAEDKHTYIWIYWIESRWLIEKKITNYPPQCLFSALDNNSRARRLSGRVNWKWIKVGVLKDKSYIDQTHLYTWLPWYNYDYTNILSFNQFI